MKELTVLKSWCDGKGKGAWWHLLQAIKAEVPGFPGAILSDYKNGKRGRIVTFEVAKIISRETGIPLAQLPFKYVHRPEEPGELTQNL